MSYIALYREWRPAVFEDVVEQEHVVRTLRHSVSTGRIAHAYLFCGTRGTGKTTMAHILSRAINCLDPKDGDPCNECEVCREILSGSSTDVLEIDAASNNSVDNVREIRDEVVYAPSKARYKVYIIDEVHMLSTGAFNALLKTLEEPPAHVVFILATTEPHKLPATILSRCQRFDFRRITAESIVGRLDRIASAKGVTLAGDAAKLIARLSEGAMRDAISLLDQCMSLGTGDIAYEDVLSVVGIVNDTFICSMVDDMITRDMPGLLVKVNDLVMDGRDIPHFISDLVLYFRNLLICRVAEQPAELTDTPPDVLEVMKKQCGRLSQEYIINIIRELSELESGMKWAASPRVLLEVTLVKLCDKNLGNAAEGVLERLAALEERINSGSFVLQPANDGLRPDDRSRSFAGPTPADSTSAEGSTAGPYAAGQAAAASASASASAAAFAPAGSDDTDPASGPAPAAPRPAKAAPGTSGGAAKAGTAGASDRYLDKWQDIIGYLKSLGRMTLYSYLLGSKAILSEGNVLGIVADSSHIKSAVSKPENVEALESAALRVLGFQVRVACVDPDMVQTSSRKAKEPEKDELVEKGKLLADRAGVPFNIIEE